MLGIICLDFAKINVNIKYRFYFFYTYITRRIFVNKSAISLALVSVFALSACATQIHRATDKADPYENINRKIFAFNDVVYENVYFPIAKGYRKITNQAVRNRVSNFVANVEEPISTANYLLQLKPKETLTSIARFAINTTLGLGGLFDVASGWGLGLERTNMNTTLASWCVADGPYTVVPFVGPGNVRSFTGMVLDTAFDPIYWATYNDANIHDKATYSYAAIKYTDKVNQLMDLYSTFKEDSVDLYATLRSAYLQNQNKLKCRFAAEDEVSHFDFDFDEDMDDMEEE